jgi:hypothetical protein
MERYSQVGTDPCTVTSVSVGFLSTESMMDMKSLRFGPVIGATGPLGAGVQ